VYNAAIFLLGVLIGVEISVCVWSARQAVRAFEEDTDG